MNLKLSTKEMPNKKYYLILIAVYFIMSVFLFNPFIASDGEFFYASIHSPIIDGDLDFSDDIRNVGWWNKAIEEGIDLTTPTGLVHNFHPIGSSLMNAPFFLGGHFVSIVGGYPADGFSPIYTGSYNIGTIVYSFFGSAILFHVLTTYLSFRKNDSIMGVLLIVLATPLLFYTFHQPSFSHGNSFFAVSLLIFIWLKYREKNNLKYWIFMGLTSGLIFMIRLVDIVFITLPLFDLFLFQRKKLKPYSKKTIQIAIYVGCIVLAFSPMMYYWYVLYAEPIPIPMPVERGYEASGDSEKFMAWTAPHFTEFLFSEHRGLFLWSPIFLFAISGYYFLYKKHKQIAILAITMTIMIFYMHSVPFDWEAGGSFGQRRTADISPFLALGLVALIDRIGINSIKSKISKSTLFFSFVSWNIIFMSIWKEEGLIRIRTWEGIKFSEHVFPHIGNLSFYLHERIRKSFINFSIRDEIKDSGISIPLVPEYWFFILIIPSIVLFFFAFYPDIRKKLKPNVA